ncbi:unnamed protein product [Caenorhabditis angaria]|uniref:Uncharacterized protein n=1 Tax=Caenorhabditis angaria TaxID=860376 RepID=A0A9P1IUA2_9PELO|nr:unnamed protein product [Caenorhabditis angaria]
MDDKLEPVSSQQLSDALNLVKNGQYPKSNLRLYFFVIVLALLISYSIALYNRESLCNAIKIDEDDAFVEKNV